MAKKIEKLIYTNERGESITFSHASIFHTNEVSGLSDVRNEIYSINSMGQDGDTYLGNRIQSREIEIVGSIRERDKDRMRDYRRQMNRVLNPQYSATLTYEYGDFRRVIDCKIDNAPAFTRKAIFQDFTIQLLCLNPFWRKEAKTRDDIATWIGGLEFPVEIPLAEGWEIGYRQPSLIVNVYNEGDVQAGIRRRVPRAWRCQKSFPFECGHTGVYKAEYHASSWRHFERVHGIRGKRSNITTRRRDF